MCVCVFSTSNREEAFPPPTLPRTLSLNSGADKCTQQPSEGKRARQSINRGPPFQAMTLIRGMRARNKDGRELFRRRRKKCSSSAGTEWAICGAGTVRYRPAPPPEGVLVSAEATALSADEHGRAPPPRGQTGQRGLMTPRRGEPADNAGIIKRRLLRYTKEGSRVMSIERDKIIY